MISHLITARKRSCDKVMFSEVFVCPQGSLSLVPCLFGRVGVSLSLVPCSFQGVSLTESPPGQRSPGQRVPWTETPLEGDPWTKNPPDRDPLNRDPLDRDPLDRDPPCTVKSGQRVSYWNAFLFFIYQ